MVLGNQRPGAVESFPQIDIAPVRLTRHDHSRRGQDR